jgi:poly(A) polymerase
VTPRDYATEVVRTLRSSGHMAYLVGGCVRDLLLNREPLDYDVATDAAPARVMQLFPKTFAVGAQFGVVLVPIPNGDNEAQRTIEVATFRADLGYSDGRHPDQVRFTSSAEEDVQRRDFTINGLLLDPISGEVLDYVSGRADLAAAIIRTIGEPAHRFSEDKLRMLRAVRFAARFGYTIEPHTFAAIRRLTEDIHQVSAERIRDELTKMLTEGHPRHAFELLMETGLLKQVLPEVAAMKGVEQPPQYHPEGDVWTHTLMLLQSMTAGGSPTLAWAALLHDVGKPPTFRRAPDRIRFDDHASIGAAMSREIARRLRMSNDEIEHIESLVAQHMKFPEVTNMRESTLKRFMRQSGFDEHLELHRMDCLASHGDLSLYNFTLEKLHSTPPEVIKPEPLITGADLIAAGYTPGPLFKQVLSEVEDLQLEGRLTSREEAMHHVRTQFPANTAS